MSISTLSRDDYLFMQSRKKLMDDYGVDNIQIAGKLPNELKSELFLLGASFDAIHMYNTDYDVIVYERTLYMIPLDR
jgi:hypothetical protein